MSIAESHHSILPAVSASPATDHARPATRGVYLPALDGLRGLAIILVICHHFIPESDHAGIIGTAVRGFGHAGWCGVDLFFVLSGFLITGIVYDARDSEHPFRNFYIRRVLRIFPLQLGVMLLVFGLITPIKAANCWVTPANRIWLWLSMANVPMALHGDWVYGAFCHFWSLAVEEQFYLVWPFLVLSIERRKLGMLCLGIVALSTALRIGMTWAGFHWITIYVSTPTRMDGLAVGSLLALLARGEGGLAAWRNVIRWAGVIAAAGLVTIVTWRGEFVNSDPIVETAGLTLLAVFFGALIAAAATPGHRTALLLWNRPVLKFFGKYSYGLYVFNLLVLALLTQSHFRSLGRVNSYLLQTVINLSVGTAITVALAWLSWNFFERHFLKLKRYFH